MYKWVWRFSEEGIGGLHELKRPGRPRRLSLDQVLDILTKTVDELPPGGTHWSQRTMAKAAGVTQYQVAEIWKAAGLKPHRVRTFKTSKDPNFAEKVVDVVGLYRYKPSTVLSQCSRFGPGKLSAEPMTTNVTARLVCMRRWT